MGHVDRQIGYAAVLVVVASAGDVASADVPRIPLREPVKRDMCPVVAALDLYRADLDAVPYEEVDFHRVLRRLLVLAREEEEFMPRCDERLCDNVLERMQ